MTGKVGNMSNYPNGFNGGLILEGLGTHRTHSGKVFYVAKGSDATGTQPAVANSKGASDGNKGTYLEPFQTLGYAVEQCVDGRGDVIICLPGMVDDVEAAIDIEAGNVTILGLGTGSERPQLTPNIDAALDVEGNGVTVQNLYFNECAAERAANGGAIDVVGTDFRLLGCHADLGAHDDNFVTVTATGENPSFEGNKFVVTADGTDAVIHLEGVVDGLRVVDNVLVNSVANVDSGLVDAEAVAITNAYLEGNVLLGGGTQFTGTADVGTVIGGTGVQRPVEITAVASEITAANDETFKPAINGNVDIHGVWFVYSAPDDTGNDITVSTETGITLLAQTETETATVAGDVLYATGQGATGVVDEAGTAETVLLSNPVRITGAAAAENLIDVVITTGTEGHATMYVAWSPADDVTTSEIQAS